RDVVGGDPSTGGATLTATAPAGDFVVSLTTNNTAAATAPPSVTVPAGATSVRRVAAGPGRYRPGEGCNGRARDEPHLPGRLPAQVARPARSETCEPASKLSRSVTFMPGRH